MSLNEITKIEVLEASPTEAIALEGSSVLP